MELAIRAVTKERKNEIIALMKKKPLSFPYADYDSLKKRTPIDVRYNSSMDVLNEDDLEAIGLPKDHLPELLLARWQAAKFVAEDLQAKGVSFVEASELCNIDKATFTRYSNAERPIGLEATSLVPLCLNVLHRPCHEVMFGCEGEIVLPGIYSEVMRQFFKCDESSRAEFLAQSDDLRKKFELKSPAVSGPGLHRDPDELIRSRLWEIAYSYGRNVEDFFGEKQPRRIRNNIRSYFENVEAYRPRMSFTMFLAFETGYALDYFIVEDFTRYTKCFFMDNGVKTRITDRDALRFIGNVFAVDHATAVKMIAPVLSDVIKNS